MTEAAFALVGAGVAWRIGSGPEVWVYTGFFWALLLAALGDWKTLYLYDVITLPMLALGLTVSFVYPRLLGGRWQSPVAAGGMFATMLGLRLLGGLLFKREALGGGDIKLMAGAAGFLGWPQAWLALLLASLLGLPMLALYRRLKGGALRDPAPFGPALALGCAVAAWDLLGGAPVLSSRLGFGAP